MYGLNGVPSKKRVALEFSNTQTFRKATRIAAEKKIPVHAPGFNTLIIKKTDKKLFKSLKFIERRIANPEEYFW